MHNKQGTWVMPSSGSQTQETQLQDQTKHSISKPKKNKTRRNHKLDTELTDKEDIKKIQEKSTQLPPTKHAEPATPERSPPKKQAWRKKEDTPTKGDNKSTPSEDLPPPASLTDQTPSATSSTPLIEIIEGTAPDTTSRRDSIDDSTPRE